MTDRDAEIPTPEQVERELQEVMAAVYQRHGCMLTSFVVISEVIEPSGMTSLWTATSDGLQSWTAMGMLQYGLTHEQHGALDEADPD